MRRNQLVNVNAIVRIALACLTLKAALCVGLWTCEAAIVKAKPPDGGEDLARKHFNHSFFGVLPTDELTLSHPYRTYFVPLTEIASGKLISSVRPSVWRYVVLRGTNAVGGVTLDADEQTGKVLGWNSLHKGFVIETIEALRAAEELPQIKKEDYEPRMLMIQGASFVAVWFHGKSDDFIIPLPPTFGRFKAYQAYSEDEIIRVLRVKAEDALKNRPELFNSRTDKL